MNNSGYIRSCEYKSFLQVAFESSLFVPTDRTCAAIYYSATGKQAHAIDLSGGYPPACIRAVSAKDKRKRRPEGWITSVECLRAPSGWCSRLGAGAGEAGAPVAVVPTSVPGTTAASASAGPARARRGYGTTTAVTSSTRSRWSGLPSGVTKGWRRPPRRATAEASSTAAGRRFVASPDCRPPPPYPRTKHNPVSTT